jgi:transcriptional regulator with XRE-family HTH domain
MTVSDIVAARVRQVRKRRDWSPADLAARCAELGAADLTENVIENIESRSARASKRPRPVTVDELLVLSLALNVAPLHLLVPPDDDSEPYPVTATVTKSRADVRRWARGLGLLARLPRVGDARLFWSEVPESEFEIVSSGIAQRAIDGRLPRIGDMLRSLSDDELAALRRPEKDEETE